MLAQRVGRLKQTLSLSCHGLSKSLRVRALAEINTPHAAVDSLSRYHYFERHTMNTGLSRLLLGTAAVWTFSAHAAPGEYWELTTKMDMPGMPMAMPATTMKLCVAKGAERDPRYSADKDCTLSDVKINSNGSSWKVRCVKDGEVMTGIGEMKGDANQWAGTIRMSGVTGGQKFDMTSHLQSKRLGGNCDAK